MMGRKLSPVQLAILEHGSRKSFREKCTDAGFTPAQTLVLVELLEAINNQ